MKNFILTGNPGVGKTTLLKECVYPFIDQVGGFLTEEIRDGKTRKGFLLKTLSGESAVLAAKGLKSRVRLNKYGVNLSVLEELGLAEMKKASSKKVLVVDEIGSMEMMSPLFCEAIANALIQPPALLATIRLRAEPFTSQIKKMSDTLLVRLDKENRVQVKAQLRHWLEEKCQS